MKYINNAGKLKIAALAILALTAAVERPTLAGDKGGSGVGNGGEIVIVDGRPVLRDRLDDTTTQCYFGTEIKSARPGWIKLLESLKNVSWYVGRIYDQEIDRLVFCFGKADLVLIDTEDKESVFEYFSERVDTKLAAIRIDRVVRADKRIYDAMTEDEKAALLFHETTHSFLPQKTDNRNSRVRNFVSTVLLNQEQPMTPEHFNFQIEFNRISLPTSTLLRTFERDIRTVLDNSRDLLRRMKAAIASAAAERHLTAVDQDVYNEVLNFDYFVQLAVKTGDVAMLRDLLTVGEESGLVFDTTKALSAAMENDNREIFVILLGAKSIAPDYRSIDELALKKQEPSFLFLSVTSKNRQLKREENLLERAIATGKRDFVIALMLQDVLYKAYPFTEAMNLAIEAMAADHSREAREAAYIALVNQVGSARNPDDVFGYASANHFTKMIGAYLEKDPAKYVNLENADGDRPIHIAIAYGDRALFDELLGMKETDLSAKKDGNTLLHLAVIYNRIDMVRTLVEKKGFDYRTENRAGHSAMKLAKMYGFKAIRDYFKSLKKADR